VAGQMRSKASRCFSLAFAFLEENEQESTVRGKGSRLCGVVSLIRKGGSLSPSGERPRLHTTATTTRTAIPNDSVYVSVQTR
jgi:hypothetical protein